MTHKTHVWVRIWKVVEAKFNNIKLERSNQKTVYHVLIMLFFGVKVSLWFCTFIFYFSVFTINMYKFSLKCCDKILEMKVGVLYSFEIKHTCCYKMFIIIIKTEELQSCICRIYVAAYFTFCLIKWLLSKVYQKTYMCMVKMSTKEKHTLVNKVVLVLLIYYVKTWLWLRPLFFKVLEFY